MCIETPDELAEYNDKQRTNASLIFSTLEVIKDLTSEYPLINTRVILLNRSLIL